MSEKQWIPFYLDLDPCESAIWMFELDKLLIKVWSRPESLWVLTKMAYMRRLHPKGVPFLGFKCMCSRRELTRQTRVDWNVCSSDKRRQISSLLYSKLPGYMIQHHQI